MEKIRDELPVGDMSVLRSVDSAVHPFIHCMSPTYTRSLPANRVGISGDRSNSDPNSSNTASTPTPSTLCIKSAAQPHRSTVRSARVSGC